MKLTFKQLNECIERVNALETELTPEQLYAIISEQFTQELNEGPTWDKIKSAGKAVIKGAAKVIGGDEDDNAKKIAALKAKKAALTAEKLKKIKEWEAWVAKEKEKQLKQLGGIKKTSTIGPTKERDVRSAAGGRHAEREWMASLMSR